MKKSFYLVLALVLMSTLVFVGCSAKAEEASATGEADAPVIEDVTLTIWVFEGEAALFDSMIEKFEELNPGVTIEVTFIPEGEYTTKIDTALIAKQPPDIGFIYEPKWIAADKFLPLTSYLDLLDVNFEDYNQGAVGRDCMVDGEVYCLGTYTGAIMLFYNKDLFDAAGLEYPSTTVPWTIDEYVHNAQLLTKKGVTLEESVWGSDADIGVWWQDWRNFIGEDGRQIDGYVNDEATVHTFERLAEIHKDGTVLAGADASSLEGVDLLATGQLAMSIIDNEIAIPMLELTDIRWGAALVPVEKEGDAAWTTTWTDAFGVFSDSKHPQEAVNFIAFLGTEGNKMRLENGHAPLNMNYLQDWVGQSKGRQEAAEVLESARANAFVPGYWDVIGPLWDAFYGDILEDDRPVKDVLDEYAVIMQETLDQAWETWDSFQ